MNACHVNYNLSSFPIEKLNKRVFGQLSHPGELEKVKHAFDGFLTEYFIKVLAEKNISMI